MATSRYANVLWRFQAHKLSLNCHNISTRLCTPLRQCPAGLPTSHRSCTSFVDNYKDQQDDCGHSDFEKLVRERRNQVRRSVLVHVYSKLVISSLHDYCSKYGIIAHAFHYCLPNDKEFVLLEFDNEQSVEALLAETKHFATHNVIPVHSRCLWYHETEQQGSSGARGAVKGDVCPAHVKTDILSDNSQIAAMLQEATSLSDQMRVLHGALRLTDLQQRLRFMACLQLEMAFSSLFTACTVLPFGSSVNGFGKNNCDLDMVMSLGQDQIGETCTSSTKLFYHTKRSLTNNRVQTQRHLESISDVISSFFPGCGSVHRILQARVPIIKFHHELVDTECDLTMSNLSGVYMSELLFLFGECDVRVRPLVTAVLKWAKEDSLTQIHPGRWITNFSLILMVIFFLQARSKPILPSLDTLKQLAGASDKRTSEGIDCSFVRNLDRFPVMDSPGELGDLLLEFFAYYSQFDFKRFGISLLSGSSVAKKEYEALYIQNPLEHELNVSKNVSADELQRIQERMKVALSALENSVRPHDGGSQPGWGLVRLLSKSFVVTAKKSKKVHVSAFYPDNSRAATVTPAITAFSLSRLKIAAAEKEAARSSNEKDTKATDTNLKDTKATGTSALPLNKAVINSTNGVALRRTVVSSSISKTGETRQRRNRSKQTATESPWTF